MTQSEIDKQLMKDAIRNSTKQSFVKPLDWKKEWQVISLMASNPFIAYLKLSAEMSVLGRLGITKKILRNMAVRDLEHLQIMLHVATTAVIQEINRRNGQKQS